MEKIFALTLAASLAAFSAFAEDDSHPCKEIKSACDAAGFKKGAHKEGKGIMKDCMMKLINGETVAGVTVSADAVTSCKEKHGKRMEKKMQRKAEKQKARVE